VTTYFLSRGNLRSGMNTEVASLVNRWSISGGDPHLL
jgi:hypothetical protein